jgi:hypothetical protein
MLGGSYEDHWSENISITVYHWSDCDCELTTFFIRHGFCVAHVGYGDAESLAERTLPPKLQVCQGLRWAPRRSGVEASRRAICAAGLCSLE